ncbi:sensor histidine kinase [Paenibacillus thailandensis]|uniref:histidine kinase n=1 Tax=Paenibacillus thailandensis TaxID=393250 RepID=A0ABW5QWR1_9BACL
MNFWKRIQIPRIRFRKLRSRFLAAMIVISLPPLCILGYFSFETAKSTLMRTNAQTNVDHLKTSSEVADLLFRNLTNLNRFIVMNDEIRDELKKKKPDDEETQTAISERTANRIQRVINNHLLDNRFVNSICLFDLEFHTYCLGRSDDAGVYEGSGKAVAIRSSDWYKEAVAAQGRVVFFGTDVLDRKDNSFSTVKLYRDSASPNGEPIGLLIVNVSDNIFGDIFNRNSSLGSFMAIDTSETPVHLVYGNGKNGESRLVKTTMDDTIDALESHDYLVSLYRNETTNWTFAHLVEKKALLTESNRIGTATAVIASLIALVAMILSYILSGTITRPLIALKKMMVEWTKGRRAFDATFERDEVGAIGETFKRMAAENEELNDKLVSSVLKEREAELKALQAQIKPHFLYNTLDSIYWMATLQNNRDVAQMAVSLSESFKLSLNKGKETIPVYKELKHIEHYMTIQNIRYKNRFRYEEDVDPQIKGMEMLKLLLQPLVENAIYHGLEPKVGEGTVRLTGRRDGDRIRFVVEDDGVGIGEMADIEKGYGLNNVKERLELYYGKSSFFRIDTVPDQGTRIVLSFKPYREQEEEGDA